MLPVPVDPHRMSPIEKRCRSRKDVRAMTGRVLGDDVELNLPGGAGFRG